MDLVIFDCDGVLIDSEPVACRVGAECLTAEGYAITAEEVARRFCGVSEKQLIATVEAELGRPLPADWPDRMRAALLEAFHRDLRAMPGVHRTLDALEVPSCVASSSRPERLHLGLRLAGLLERFQPNVFSAAMVERGKPAPDLFLLAAERMGVPPSRCAVVEDSVAGIRAAVAAGMFPIGFTGGGHCLPGHADRLRAEGARAVARDMAELGTLLAGLACRSSSP